MILLLRMMITRKPAMILWMMMITLVTAEPTRNKSELVKEDSEYKNESENRNNNKRIIHDNNEDIDIKIDTDIDMITVHTADHQLSINLLGKSSLSLYLGLTPPWIS